MESNSFDFKEHDLTFVSEIAQSRGGHVKVYEVEQEKKSYALKVISKAYLAEQGKIQYIYNEKEALLDFDHPGIVKLIKTLKDEKYICFLMELVYGCPLNKILSIDRSICLEFIRFVGVQLALILEYIHSKGYVYRDIKASNIIVDKEGRIKLLDMGLAKKIHKERTKSFCGTIHAMAPEIIEDNEEGYSYEVDYYAFGILLFELATGEPPFGYENAENIGEIKRAILKGITEEHLKKILNKDLRSLIDRLLQRDANKRVSKGFTEILEDTFFKRFDIKEIEAFLKGKRLDDTSFGAIQNEFEIHLETIYLSGRHPEYNPDDDF